MSALSGMSASALQEPRVSPIGDGGLSHYLRVEVRAAALEETRQIDLTDDEVAFPAYVLMTPGEWRRAMAAFPPKTSNKRHEASWDRRPPGSSLWAQLASRSGDRIVGGRDQYGFPSLPAPDGDGNIRFMVTGSVPGPGACQPVIDRDGAITCISEGCRDCLRALTRNTWNTTIACVCGP